MFPLLFLTGFVPFSSACVVFSDLSYINFPRGVPPVADGINCLLWWACCRDSWNCLCPARGSSCHLSTEATPAASLLSDLATYTNTLSKRLRNIFNTVLNTAFFKSWNMQILTHRNIICRSIFA